MVARKGDCPNCRGIQRQRDRYASAPPVVKEEAAMSRHLTDHASSSFPPPSCASSLATAAAENENAGGARAHQVLTDRERFFAIKAALDDVLLRKKDDGRWRGRGTGNAGSWLSRSWRRGDNHAAETQQLWEVDP